MIFVSGVSKSGKTYTIQNAVKIAPTFEHVKASKLLKAGNRPLYGLNKEQILENQTALLEALVNLKHPTRNKLVLDGHAVIETFGGATALPDWVFDSLELSGIVVIVAPIEEIVHRRQGTLFEKSEAAVTLIQMMEQEHCSRQSQRLSIPFAIIQSGDATGLVKTLLGMIKPDEAAEAFH